MRRRIRIVGFGVSLLVLAGVFGWGISGLPHFGEFSGHYGQILNHAAVGERHVTNVVAAIVFDYRGVDTLGEEFILFAAVMGVTLLFREVRDEEAERPRDVVRNDAVRAVGLSTVGATVVLGLYIVAHGYITPGGGFQGGVACAGGLALLYAAGEYRAYRRASPTTVVEFAEGFGAGGFAGVGVGALAIGSAFLANVLPLGRTGELDGAGTIALANALAGVAVTAAIVLLFHEFIEELMDPRDRGGFAP